MNNVSFSNLFDFKKKSKIKAGDGLPLNEGSYPFYTSSNILKKSINEFIFDGNSLIFGTGGSASVHYCNERFAVSTDCFVTQPKNNDELFLKYIYYFLRGNIHILEKGFKGAGLKHISKGYISDIKIPLPPLDHQKKIAAILDAVDAYKQKTKVLIEKYDELTQSLFLDMFGDPVTNPKRWKELPLSTSIDLIIDYRGKTPPKSKSGIPLLSSANVQDGKIDLSYEQYISVENYKNWIVRGLTKPGDLLFTTEAPVTEVALIPNDGNKYQISRRVMALRFMKNKINNFYALHLMMQKNWSERLKKLTRGSTVPRLLKPDILKQLLIVPPIELQNQFAKRIKAIEAQKAQAQASLAQADDLFNSLLQRAFKGELAA